MYEKLRRSESVKIFSDLAKVASLGSNIHTGSEDPLAVYPNWLQFKIFLFSIKGVKWSQKCEMINSWGLFSMPHPQPTAKNLPLPPKKNKYIDENLTCILFPDLKSAHVILISESCLFKLVITHSIYSFGKLWSAHCNLGGGNNSLGGGGGRGEILEKTQLLNHPKISFICTELNVQKHINQPVFYF